MTTYNDQLSAYIGDLFASEDEALQQIRAAIPQRGLPKINIQPEEGRFLQLLVRAASAINVVEIGTLGGYSGVWIARGLAPGGRLLTLELEPRHAEVAREHFALAGVSDHVEVLVGDAHALLPTLAAEGPFDLVFIDAEKTGYLAYLEWAQEHTRIGGVIVAHNAFRAGDIVGPSDEEADEGTRVMRALNQRIAQDARLLSTIYPGGDGMVIAVKVAE